MSAGRLRGSRRRQAIARKRYRWRQGRAHVCDCPKIHMYEVEFKLEGMIVVPTHKNCGASLNDKQADKFQKELVKSWGFEDEEEED